MARGAAVSDGVFVREDGGAPLVGDGRLQLRDDGLRVVGRAEPRVFITVLSVVLALFATALVVPLAMAALDALGWITDGGSLRRVVTLGTGTMVGSYWLARRFLPRVIPLRDHDTLVALRYVVSVHAENGVVRIATSAPGLEGRLVFRTTDAAALAAAITRAKAS